MYKLHHYIINIQNEHTFYNISNANVCNSTLQNNNYFTEALDAPY